MGWINYSLTRGIDNLNLFVDDEMVRMFFIGKRSIYVLKEVGLPTTCYIFIKVNRYNYLEMEISKIKNNIDLLSLVKENLAYSKNYKRLLKINSIKIK